MYFPLGDWDKAKPYLKASVGYSVFAAAEADEDIEGGLYFSAALGAEYKNFVGEVTAANYDGEYGSLGFSYQKIGFTLGYRFNIEIFKPEAEIEE
jgi:hypothetical protein